MSVHTNNILINKLHLSLDKSTRDYRRQTVHVIIYSMIAETAKGTCRMPGIMHLNSSIKSSIVIRDPS